MSQYRISPANCPHPDFALEFRAEHPARPASQYQSAYAGNPNQMLCLECGWRYEVKDAADFVRQREIKLLRDEGKDASVKRDMFGNEIRVGSMVVYPHLSGRSATLSYGKVVEINPSTKSKWASGPEPERRPRADSPDKLKVQPMPYTSRWRSWRGDDAKPVTLSANAPSVVVIK